MKMHQIKSSHIESIGHDSLTGTLKITYKGNKSYIHKDVSDDDFAGLLAAESTGKHLRQMDIQKTAMPFVEEDDTK